MLADEVSVSAAKTRFICVLASPRTGSNLLFSLLRNCQGLNLKYELFHPKWAQSVTEIDRQALGLRAGSNLEDDEALCAWRKEHPGKTLETLYKSGKKNPLIFKVFPNHLSYERLHDEIIARDDVGYILLRRRAIESYISEVKAKEFQTFHKIDTTLLPPRIKPAHFIRWATKIREWYDWLEKEIPSSGSRYTKLSYERDLDIPKIKVALGNAVKAMDDAGLPCTMKKTDLVVSTKRQDHETRYQDRVSNWPAFEAALRANPEHAELLEWTEAV